MNAQGVISEHYRRLADRYDEFLLYSPAFVRRLAARMIEQLALTSTDVLVDLGCGTGIYAREILKQVQLEHRVIGVDSSEEMLARIPAEARLRRVKADALTFSSVPDRYDKILMKEAIHHVEDRRALLENLFERLQPGGRLLLVHVPPKLHYPLFQRALDRCLRWHADPDDLERLLLQSGFQVERDSLEHLHRVPKDAYFRMVESRYMSVLSSFSDEEIREGLKEMRETHRDRCFLEFVDHFDFLTGIRPA